MALLRKGLLLFILIAILGISLFYSCGDKSTDNQGPFVVFGRVIFRPILAGPSSAEFYLFHKGSPITTATILVRQDTIPLQNSHNGLYSRNLQNVRIGDTLDYSISSEYGSSQGTVIIPDTAFIIRPVRFDSLFPGAGFGVTWHPVSDANGYFVHLENQNGYIATVSEARTDTSVFFSGDSLVSFGVDSLWVETLKGAFFNDFTPDGIRLPEGVVGSAGNYREVYVNFPR
jgi:hypothetical protein